MYLFNPILSKCFIYSNLKYSDTGLYYVNKSTSNRDYIFITDDQEKIVSLLGLDPKVILEIEDKLDFFEMIANCKYVYLRKFLKFKDTESFCQMLKEFSMYLNENEIDTNRRWYQIHMSSYCNINPDFMRLLEESNLWLTKGVSEVKSKFNGGEIKKYFPDYDMTKLSETIPKFKNSFKDKRTFDLFILYNTTRTIMDKFMLVTENKKPLTMIEKLRAHLQSDEGKASADRFFNKINNEREMKKSQLSRFHDKYNDIDKFSKLVDKIINKYDSNEYVNREHSLGREPMEDLFFFLYEYAQKYGSIATDEQEEEYGNSFTSGLYIIHGYYFNLMNGQGSVIKVGKIK